VVSASSIKNFKNCLDDFEKHLLTKPDIIKYQVKSKYVRISKQQIQQFEHGIRKGIAYF